MEVVSMTDKQQDAKREVMAAMPEAPLFVRLRVFKMMDDNELTVEQASVVIQEMTRAYRNGVDYGEHQALYARIPEGWPRMAGRPVNLHKIWDMLVLEYEVRGEPGEYRYAAHAGRNNWWGKVRKDMHAAIADALGFKHDGDMSEAGEYIIRMLGIEES